MSSSVESTVREDEVRQKLRELQDRDDVLVAQADWAGDKIRYYPNHDSAPYQVRSSLTASPRFFSEDVLVELVVEHAERLYWEEELDDG